MTSDGVISIATAGQVIDLAALGLLVVALAGTIVRSLPTAIGLLALQGLLLGVAAGAAALAEMEWRSWAAFAVALLVKAILIPLILLQVLRRMHVRTDIETMLPVKIAVPLVAASVPLAWWVVEPFADVAAAGFQTTNALPVALAMLLVGLFTMVTRRKALTQVIGLVTMENGIYLATVAATRGLPFAVEFGVALDVLTGVALMALVIHEINRLTGTTNVDRLQALRG